MPSLSDAATAKSRYFLMLFQVEEDDGLGRMTAMKVTEALATRIKTPQEETEIDVWLESPGGDAHCAYKIAASLQEFASCLRVVIPDYAKSAATLMALAADELYMARTAELGPLDAQVSHPLEKDERISALAIAKCTEHLADTALGIVLRGGFSVLDRTGLDRRETLTRMLTFAADFTYPIAEKLDPMWMHQASALLRVAEKYGELLLAKRGALCQKDPDTVLRAFVRDYPSHGFVIDKGQAEEIGLHVQPAEQYEYWSYVESLYYATIKSGKSCCGLMSHEDLLRHISRESENGDNGNGQGAEDQNE